MRVKGGKAGSAPAKRPPAADSAPAAALMKRPRGGETAEAVPKQTSAAQNGNKQQEVDIDEEPGLAGLLGELCASSLSDGYCKGSSSGCAWSVSQYSAGSRQAVHAFSASYALSGGYGSDDDEEDNEASGDGKQPQEKHATNESRGAHAEQRAHERQMEQLPSINVDDTVRGPRIAEEEAVDYD